MSLFGRILARPTAWLRARHDTHSEPGAVCYFPPFRDAADLTDHYHRARWYLPFVAAHCTRVDLFTTAALRPGERPPHMAEPTDAGAHIAIGRGRLAHLRRLLRARLVVVWSKRDGGALLLLAARAGFPVAYVANDDPDAVEYGTYCSLLWKFLLSGRERFAFRQRQEQRLREVAARLRERDCASACVFGTGPSLEEAFDFDFSACLTIACNSIVQNRALLDHLRPVFIAAGDVVSHFGVSAYAGRFRRDLIRTLTERDTLFVATDSFGYLLLVNHPEIAARVLLVPQTCDGPNYDLVAKFSAPKLDSVLNILMLPLAATFCRRIFLLGCDGKSERRSNEDFWAHARGAQYDDLVATGHQCHPTFDINRQRVTYDRYNDSIEATVINGEGGHGIVYRCLRPSNTPVLRDRLASDAERQAFA